MAPDLRGLGASGKHPGDPTIQYSADAQARSVIALIEELGLDRPVLGGHDIGSRIAQTVARHRPDLVRALVLTPPLPGIGERILAPAAQQEFWYLSFHQLDTRVEALHGLATRGDERVRQPLLDMLESSPEPSDLSLNRRATAPADRAGARTTSCRADRSCSTG